MFRKSTMRARNLALLLSGGLFLFYVAYIVWSKLGGAVGLRPPLALGEIGEFLAFATCIVVFTAAVVLSEKTRSEEGERSWLVDLDRNLERYLMLACYIFCCAVIIHDVARRFLLNYSAAWSQETAQYAFIYLGWIGAAYAVKERAHIRFDIVLNALPIRLQGVIYVLGEIATILFAVIALRFTWHTAEQLWQFGAVTPVLRVSKLWAESAILIGFTLIIVRSLQMLRKDLADLVAGRRAYQGKALFEE